MVILMPQEDKVRTTLIPGHAILDVCIKEPDSSIKIQKQKSMDSTVICTTNRKQKVLGWLKENLLPVTEMNDNIVFGNVIILPPYQVTDICTNSPMVAMQLVNIMNKMPDDYNPP
ncbi:unnamed protein product [Danaus chrysippus]|uniref:(African queen) hypothetical protein n=1 Tax=Danaus chrysippus TaxID=151541 RepID=A0A8J2R6L6_9NEOP|nr:unnamed protein product [Danaus chrysippus]